MRASKNSNNTHTYQSGNNSVLIGEVSGGSIHLDGLGEEQYKKIISHLDNISLALQSKNALSVNIALTQNSLAQKLTYSAKTYFSKLKTTKIVLEKCATFGLWNTKDMTKTIKYLLNNMYEEILLCVSLDNNLDCETSERKIKCAMYEYSKAITFQQKRSVDGFVRYILHCVREHIESEEKNDYISNVITNANLSIKEELKVQYSKLLSAIQYENSFAQHINEMCITKRVINNPLHYLSSQVRFYGRDKEILLLNNFVDDERLFLFTVITGDGGSGKSKLVYYYLKLYLSADWKAVYLSEDDINSLVQKCKDCPYPEKLFIAVDYAGKAPESLGKLMDLLSSKVKFKTRILLIERQGMVNNDNYPHWYYRLIGTGEKRENLLNLYHQMSETYFLELSYLSELAFREMAQDYANAFSEKRTISDVDWNEIWNHAKKIESRETPRPLIVLFITDAFIHGGNFDKWDTTKLIEHIVNRYDEHSWRRACGNDTVLYNSVIRTLAFATASGVVEFSDTPEILKPDVEIMLNGTEPISFDENTREALVCAINQSSEYEEKIKGFEPDIAGECFVLLWLIKNEYNSHKKRLWEYMWEYRGQSMETFILRCVSDFANFTNFKRLFKNEMEELLIGCKNDLYISRILLSYIQTNKVTEVETLASVNNKINWNVANEDTVMAYVNEILSSYKKNLKKESSVLNLMSILRDIAMSTAHSEAVRKHYINIVIDYSMLQLQNCKNNTLYTKKLLYVKKLKNISIEHNSIIEVTSLYIEALNDYSHLLLFSVTGKNIIEDERFVEELRNIAEENPNCMTVVLFYVKALQKLFDNYKSMKNHKILKQVYDLYTEYKNDEILSIYMEILEEYSMLLLSSITGRNIIEDERVVNELKSIVKENPYSTTVVLFYAKALQKLFNNYNNTKEHKNLKQLYDLYIEYKNDEILSIYKNTVIQYAETLSKKCMNLNLNFSYEYLIELISLVESNNDLLDINSLVVKTIVNVYFNQYSRDTVSKLSELMNDVIIKIQNSIIIICDAINSLLEKSKFHNLAHIMRTKEILLSLIDLSGNEKGITLEYAKFLTRIIERVEFIKIDEFVSELEIMAIHSGKEFIELYDDAIIKISSYLRYEIEKQNVYSENPKLELLKNLLSLNENINHVVCDYAIALKWCCLISDISPIDSINLTIELRDLYLKQNNNAFVFETYRHVVNSILEQIVKLIKQHPSLDKVEWEFFFAMSELEKYHNEHIENIKWWNAKIKYEYLDWLIFIYTGEDFSVPVKLVVENIIKNTDINYDFEANNSVITLEILELLRETIQSDLIDSYKRNSLIFLE